MVGDRPDTPELALAAGINSNLLSAHDDQEKKAFPPGQTTQLELDVDGQKRTADVHVPQGWDGKSALPTLYYFKALHPGDPEPESFTGLSKVGDREGVMVVYLNGQGWMNSWNNGQRDYGRSLWSTFVSGKKDGPDENKFLNAVHDKLSSQLPLDPTRQGLTGFSHGGSEAYALASQNNWVSSVQSDEGYMTGYEKPLSRPISQQTIHALHDPVIPYGGTEQVKRIMDKEAENDNDASWFSGEPIFDPSMWFHMWEYNHEKNGNMIQDQKYIVDAYNRANGLVDPKTGKAPDPVVTKKGDIETRSWINNSTGAETRQVVLGTGSHGWAGSTDHSNDFSFHNIGIPNETFNASDAMVDFLKKHPLIDPSAKPVETTPTTPVETTPTTPVETAPTTPVEPKPAPPVETQPVTPTQTDQTPPKATQPDVPPLVGQPVTKLEPGINPRLGCAVAVSAAIHLDDPRIAQTNNVDILRHELMSAGYQATTYKPGSIKAEDLQKDDVILGYRQGKMPRHAARYIGDGKVFQNDSNTGRMVNDASVDHFNRTMHDENGKFNPNGFEYVIVLRKPADS